jgi:hypothetical protein
VRNSCETDDKMADFNLSLSSRTRARDSACASRARSMPTHPDWQMSAITASRWTLGLVQPSKAGSPREYRAPPEWKTHSGGRVGINDSGNRKAKAAPVMLSSTASPRENFLHLPGKDLCNGMVIMKTCQRCAEFVKLGGFAFARRRRGKTSLHAPHQLADHNCNDQKDDQNDHVYGAVNCKGVIRLDEKIIERQECASALVMPGPSPQ